MNVHSFNYVRRFLVNGILGGSIGGAFWLLVSGTYVVDADKVTIFDWQSANWVWVGIFALYSAAGYQYLSIMHARTRGLHGLALLGIAAWGGAISALASADLICALLGKTVEQNILSFVAIGFAGCTVGVVLWTRANAVRLQYLLGAASEH